MKERCGRFIISPGKFRNNVESWRRSGRHLAAVLPNVSEQIDHPGFVALLQLGSELLPQHCCDVQRRLIRSRGRRSDARCEVVVGGGNCERGREANITRRGKRI